LTTIVDDQSRHVIVWRLIRRFGLVAVNRRTLVERLLLVVAAVRHIGLELVLADKPDIQIQRVNRGFTPT
jgi:hypothetical protein